jgi:GR25 family glycosyltransferase involved in LPS biosynthesis
MTPEREKIIQENLKLFPFITVTKSINGYDIPETLARLKDSQLIYKHLEFPTYGTLANFLTKYFILKYQIETKLPYLCFIEDDLLLSSSFITFIEEIIPIFDNYNINMIRLAKWGEGYVTSLDGAHKIIDLINTNGIIANIDNQLRKHCGPEYSMKNTPWKLMIRTNGGDCLKTQKIIRK